MSRLDTIDFDQLLNELDGEARQASVAPVQASPTVDLRGGEGDWDALLDEVDGRDQLRGQQALALQQAQAQAQQREQAAIQRDLEELVGGPVRATGRLGDMPATPAMDQWGQARQEGIRRIRAGEAVTPEQFKTLTADEQSYAWANNQRDRVRQMSIDDWRRVPLAQRKRLILAGATPEPTGVRPESLRERAEVKVVGGALSVAGAMADAPRALAELPETIMEASLRERGMLTPGLERDVKRPKMVEDLLHGIEMAEQITGPPRNKAEVVADSVAGLMQLFGEIAVMHKPSMATGRLLRSSLGKIFASRQVPAMAGWMGTIGMFGVPRTYSQVATGQLSAGEGAKHVTGAGLSLLADVPAGVMKFVRNMATMPKRPDLKWFEDTVHAIEPAAHLFLLHQGFKAGRRAERAGQTHRARVEAVDQLERTSRTVTRLADLAAEQRAARIRQAVEGARKPAEVEARPKIEELVEKAKAEPEAPPAKVEPPKPVEPQPPAEKPKPEPQAPEAAELRVHLLDEIVTKAEALAGKRAQGRFTSVPVPKLTVAEARELIRRGLTFTADPTGRKLHVKVAAKRVEPTEPKAQAAGEIESTIHRHLESHTRPIEGPIGGPGKPEKPSKKDMLGEAADFAKRQQQERPLGRGRAKGKPAPTDWTQRDRQVAERVMTDAAYRGKNPNPAGLARLTHRLERLVLGSLQIDPRRFAERAVGREVTASVVKAAHHAEAELLRWDNEKIATVADATYGALGELLDKTYTPEQLLDFMASRGKPVTPEGRQIQQNAMRRLPKGLADRTMREAIQEIHDHNYRLLSQVAEGDVSYVEDYFYGLFRDREATRRFLDHYRTTTRYLKQKTVPTVADAIAFDLELRNVNPVWNARAEARHIYQRASMQQLRDRLVADGEGRFITEYEDAKVWQRRYWEYVPDEPLFKGLLMEPALARLLRNMISVNKVSKSPMWSTVRNVNNVLRSVKFLGSAFHAMVIGKQSIADSGWLGFLDPRKVPTIARQTLNPGFRPRRVKAMTDEQFQAFLRGDRAVRRRVTARLGLTDPTFATPEYVEYARLGGGHRYSIESEAQQFLDKILTSTPMNRFLRYTTWPVREPLRYGTAGPRAFVRWMFDRWIPAVKYAKYLQEVDAKSRKVARGLSDAEKQEVIREGQNFYGEMNERLFGRSGTATSILRFFFLAPGFREGNYRTLWKATAQWRGGRAWRSRRNIPQSLLLSGILASVGTRILTGDWPGAPANLEKFRDLFKIRTPWKDQRDREIYLDVLTYDKDYFEQLVRPTFKLATGHPIEAIFGAADVLIRTAGGMTSPLLGLTTDLGKWVQGEPITDWRGERLWYEHDPALTRLFKFAQAQWERSEPISASVARRMIARKTSPAVAFLTAVAGMRPATSEHEKELVETTRDIWSLRDEQERLYYHLGTLKDPAGKIDRYNRMVDQVLADREIPTRLRDTVGRLKIDTERLLSNKVMALTGPSIDEQHVTKAMEYLRNFGVTRERAEELLKEHRLTDSSRRGQRLRRAGQPATRRMRPQTIHERMRALRARWLDE